MREIEKDKAPINLSLSEGPLVKRMLLTEESYSRGEPVEAMSFTLRFGILPESKRIELGQDSLSSPRGEVHASHIQDRVSLGKGPINRTGAAALDFGGPGNVIYKLSPMVEDLKSFMPAMEHADNGEFYIKRVPIEAIQGLLFNEVDRERVVDTLEQLRDGIMWGQLPVVDHSIGESLQDRIIHVIDSLEMRSVEEEKEIVTSIRGF